MISQTNVISKPFFTNITLLWFSPNECFLILYQIIFLSKAINYASEMNKMNMTKLVELYYSRTPSEMAEMLEGNLTEFANLTSESLWAYFWASLRKLVNNKLPNMDIFLLKIL